MDDRTEAESHDRAAPPGIDVAAYDRFVQTYSGLSFPDILADLRNWDADRTAGQSVAVMGRLIELCLAPGALDQDDREKAIVLAAVIEQVVRSKLSEKREALATIEEALRVLLIYDEVYSPDARVVTQLHEERERRGLPPVDG